MANALTADTPPMDAPDMGNALTSGEASAPQGNALRSGAPAAPMQPQGQQQPAPQMSHEEVVAALRHFDAVKNELQIIAADPKLGKATVKGKIIDGVTRLVSECFMKPADAVTELSKVPTEPLLQMKWVKSMLAQAMQAENAILDHFGATQPHFGTVEEHFAASKAGKRDDHMDHLASLAASIGNKPNG